MPDSPWETISVDFIVELPESAGHDVVMVVVDSVTKMAHFVPALTMTSAAGTVDRSSLTRDLANAHTSDDYELCLLQTSLR